jgi:hypothetical protein
MIQPLSGCSLVTIPNKPSTLRPKQFSIHICMPSVTVIHCRLNKHPNDGTLLYLTQNKIKYNNLLIDFKYTFL